MDGWTVLDHLKHHPATRHIPVHIVSAGDGRQNALKAGAVAFVEKPISKESPRGARSARSATFIDRDLKRVLVVEDDEVQRNARRRADRRRRRRRGDRGRRPARRRSRRSSSQHYDCMVLDLKLPEMGGFALLEKLQGRPALLVDPGDRLHRQGAARAGRRRSSRSSPSRSSSRTPARPSGCSTRRRSSSTASSAKLPQEKRRMLEQLHSADEVFKQQEDPDRRRRRAERLRAHERARVARHGGVYAENGKDGIDAPPASTRRSTSS